MIFCSFSECLGCPLLEARQENKVIIAPDLDYVWDLLIPDFSFNTKIYNSLIRAVLLCLGNNFDIDPKLRNGFEMLDYIKNKKI